MMFRISVKKCYRLPLLVIAVLGPILLINMFLLLDDERKLNETCLLQSLRFVKGNQGLTKSMYLLAVADVELAKLPPLPTLPNDKTNLFKNTFSETEVKLLSSILQTFHQVMVNASLQYFLYRGALLGSYRHHSIIPWGDGVKVLVHERDKRALWQTFQKLLPNLTLSDDDSRFQFYHKSGHTVGDRHFGTTCIDVSFYNDNATHLWDITLLNQAPFLTFSIFPLQDRPFLGHLYPAPRDPLANLQMIYEIDLCNTVEYRFALDTVKNTSETNHIPCSALTDFVPFVSHVRGPGGAWCEELLTFRGDVLNTFIRSSNRIPVC